MIAILKGGTLFQNQINNFDNEKFRLQNEEKNIFNTNMKYSQTRL